MLMVETNKQNRTERYNMKSRKSPPSQEGSRWGIGKKDLLYINVYIVWNAFLQQAWISFVFYSKLDNLKHLLQSETAMSMPAKLSSLKLF